VCGVCMPNHVSHKAVRRQWVRRCRLKRMSDQAYREQCVATTTEVASPVPSDDLAMARIRPLLAHTRLETAQLRCGIPI